MYNKKIFTVLSCGILVTALTFQGCSIIHKENLLRFSDISVTGIVKSVEKNEIVLAVSANNSGGQMQSPPEMPQDGEKNGQDGQQQSPPEIPQGEGIQDSAVSVCLTIQDESVLQAENGENAVMEDVKEGDVLTVQVDKEGKVTKIIISEMQNNTEGVESYEALKEFTGDERVSEDTFISEEADENTLYVHEGAEVSLENVKAYRNSDDSTGGDTSSFYGVGADLLVSDGTAYVSGGEYTTDADGGAGMFAYNKGTVYAADSVIRTNKNTSGGVHTAGGGALYGWNLDVETQGESSAAIRSDRGGGKMVLDGGRYVSDGTGSPAVYCTADIAVNKAELIANNSEGICIEGRNALHLYDCDLTGNMKDDEQNDCTWNVIVYQSMSGDSEIGNSTFHMAGGTLTAGNGGIFYTTNTECTMLISDVDITYARDCEFFLRCTGNANARGWGQTGSNGSKCKFTADSQDMQGDIIYDSISTLDFYMTNGSTLTGAIVDDETYAGNGGNGYCNVYLSADSVWNVTGDSMVTMLCNEGKIKDSSGKTVSVMGTDGTVYVEGDSLYTVTTESYQDSGDMEGAECVGSFGDYQIERPEKL